MSHICQYKNLLDAENRERGDSMKLNII